MKKPAGRKAAPASKGRRGVTAPKAPPRKRQRAAAAPAQGPEPGPPDEDLDALRQESHGMIEDAMAPRRDPGEGGVETP